MEARDYEILGLQPETDLKTVRHRYDMLMKRSIHDEGVEVTEITKAYDRIMAENTVDYFNSDAELLDAKGINKKKIRNYIYQNKIKLGIIAWIIVGIGLILYILIYQPGNIKLIPDMMPF